MPQTCKRRPGGGGAADSSHDGDGSQHSASLGVAEDPDPIAGPGDALEAESLRQLHAVWPALFDALQPLLDEIVYERGDRQ